jgi:ribosomal protein L24
MAVRTSVPKSPKVPEIRKGDTVVVLTGKDAGKRGKVEHVIRRDPASSPVRSGYRRVSLKGGVYVVVEAQYGRASTGSPDARRRIRSKK